MIPLLDLQKQYQSIRPQIDARLQEILASGRFILGPQVEQLEAGIAGFCGVGFGVGVASGTDALELALLALGVKAGDEVITTPFTFIATAEAITQVGAKPIFADIDLETYTINVHKIKEKITPRTKALILVHLYGQPCQMAEIMQLAKDNNLFVIEDCAQAIAAEYRGRKTGSFGDVGCFSFFPSKNLGGYGDAGMVVTNNENIAEKIRMLRVHGSKDKYFHLIKGRNSRLDEMQAGILNVKLKYLNRWSDQRIEKAKIYSELLHKDGSSGEMVIPEIAEGTKHVFHLYVIRVKQRDRLAEFLKKKGISTGIHYPVPLHLQQVYKQMNHQKGDFPNAELAAGEVISLPLYPELDREDINYIVSSIGSFFNGGKAE